MAVDEPPPILLHRRDVKVAEAPAERDEVPIVQVLFSKQQHLMIEPRFVNRRETLIVQGPQIDVTYLRAESSAAGNDGDVGAHGLWLMAQGSGLRAQGLGLRTAFAKHGHGHVRHLLPAAAHISELPSPTFTC